MTHYAGIDVSLETSSICIVDGSGAVLRELKAESEPEALAAALTGAGLEFAVSASRLGRCRSGSMPD
jgi:predicted NBD/HSP70 family sugar kinase